MGCPYLVLIAQHYFVVSKINTLHKFTDPFPVGLERIFPANIAKHIWMFKQRRLGKDVAMLNFCSKNLQCKYNNAAYLFPV